MKALPFAMTAPAVSGPLVTMKGDADNGMVEISIPIEALSPPQTGHVWPGSRARCTMTKEAFRTLMRAAHNAGWL